MKKKSITKKVGVILMTYGSPKTLKDVPQYLQNVYGGKKAPAETVKEFIRRYKVIGGSPLVKITVEQARSLEKELNKNSSDTQFFALAGMRFSDPFIKDQVTSLAKKVDHIVGIILSPQYSPLIMQGYTKELTEAMEKVCNEKQELSIVTDWHMEENFIAAMSQKVTQALRKLPDNVMVLFSAHSMPKKVIEKEPDYIHDLKETAAAIAKSANLSKKRWMFCYQSAGHTPEEWLKPDFADIMPILKKKGETHVLIAPVQFLADHLEILYDVGIGAREQAEENGIVFARTESLNTSPLFIKSLAAVVQAALAEN